MPHSAGSSLLRVQELNDTYKLCLIALATHPGDSRNYHNANFRKIPPTEKVKITRDLVVPPEQKFNTRANGTIDFLNSTYEVFGRNPKLMKVF